MHNLKLNCDNDTWQLDTVAGSLNKILYQQYGSYPKFDTITLYNQVRLMYGIILDYPFVDNIIIQQSPFSVVKQCNASIWMNDTIFRLKIRDAYQLNDIHNIGKCNSIVIGRRIW